MKNRKSNLLCVVNIIQLCRPSLFIHILIVVVINSIDPVLNVLIIKYCLNSIENKRSIKEVIFVLFYIMIYVLITNIYFSWYQNKYILKTSVAFNEYMSKQIFVKAERINMDLYDKPEFYDLYLRATKEADNRCLDLINSFMQFATNLFGMLLMISVILTMDLNAIMITTVFTMLSIVFALLSNRPRFEREQALIPEYRKKNYVKRVYYLPEYIKELRMFNITKMLLHTHEEASNNSYRIINKYGKKLVLFSFLFAGISSFTEPVVIVYLISRVFQGVMGFSDFVSVLTATQQYQSMLNGILQFFPQVKEHFMYLNKYKEFLEIDEFLLNSEGKKIYGKFQELSIKEICFAYDKTNERVIENLSLKIEKGDKVLVIGGNGAGKSSLIKLLLKFYEPQSGVMRLNFLDYKECNVDSIREYFSVMFQDFQIYSMTIAENILMKQLETEKEEMIVKDVLKKCKLWDKVRNLEDGINTVLTREFDDSGEVFSGGERQKIALARTIVKSIVHKSEIIILDEPTSAMDIKSENDIFNMLFEVFEKKTLIVISHRIVFKEKMNSILYLDHGSLQDNDMDVKINA